MSQSAVNAAYPDDARVRWQCRRGMLELDLMLQAFMDKRYQQLDERSRQAFLRLLKCQDQNMLDYLMQHVIPEDKDVADVVEQIRNAAGPAV